MTKSTTKTTTCIVGGGNSAHVLIPFLAEAGHCVHLLTRRPNDWSDTVVCQIQKGETVVTTHQGNISRKSSRPIDVIPQADIIVLCLPVHQYRTALRRIAPYINQSKANVYIGTIYGQANFRWMVQHEVEKAQNLSNVVTFAVGSIPWICRTLEYGKVGINYGGKAINTVAVSPPDCFKKLQEIFLEDISLRPLQTGRFEQACFLSLTMSVDNQILHPARCYGLWKRYGGVWDTLADVPYFYRDFDQLSADILAKLDAEYEMIRQVIKKRFPHLPFQYMLSYLELEKLNHNSQCTDILSTLRDSAQLGEIKTPTVEGPDGRRYLDTKCRFFLDDIPYGLLIAKSVAEMFQIETPFITEVIEWAQDLRGEEFIVEGRINREFCLGENVVCGIPQAYGITKIEELVE
ncbi:hypothetical protein FisN_7Lh276 [Fistulifera solaris]|uniref:Opine dehydrogenase domain-containing protein n=1 Tax=Fistulifera solaris TaxID=1519565 RepID=A0A1Z5JR85_FISSO|nr:hypothetical protein FisN_7Lh276 [Fistulifera solaris]|eukprot:GAX16550.1 hypothetical protein FisN_7Lh276 [Fistulifera solaris]